MTRLASMAMASHRSDDLAGPLIIHYLYPSLVFFYYIVAYTISACTHQSASSKYRHSRAGRKIIILLELVFLSTYVAEIVSFISQAIIDRHWSCAQSYMVYLVFSAMIWSFESYDLVNSTSPITFPHYGSWAIAVVAEITLLVLSAVFLLPADLFTWTTGAIRICRTCLVVALPVAFLVLRKKRRDNSTDEESRPLLRDGRTTPSEHQSGSTDSADHPSYGTTHPADGQVEISASTYSHRQEDQSLKDQFDEAVRRHGSLWEYAKRFMVLAPYLYPLNDWLLQLKVGLVILLSLATCVLEVLIARQVGVVVEVFISSKGNVPWIPIIIYLLLKLLISRFGIAGLRELLWNAYDNFVLHSLSITAFMNLTQQCDTFHDRAKLIDVHRTIEYTKAIRNLLRSIATKTIPGLAGLVTSLVFLVHLFSVYLGIAVVSVAFLLLVTRPKLDQWKSKPERQVLRSSKEQSQKAKSIIETWKSYLDLEQKSNEKKAYDLAVNNHTQALTKNSRALYITDFLFGSISLLGLVAATSIAGYQVGHGVMPIGNFVALIVYWPYLTECLLYLTNFGGLQIGDLLMAESYMNITQTIPSTEEARFDSQPSRDEDPREGLAPEPRTQPLTILQANQSAPFRGRRHGMDIMEGLAFECGTPGYLPASMSSDGDTPGFKHLLLRAEDGKQVTFVGNQGSALSTVLRLLPGSDAVLAGKISIKDVNFQDMDQTQLCDYLSVVAQVPDLRDDTILSLIREAKEDATDDEIRQCCIAAGFHTTIMQYAEKYKTVIEKSDREISSVTRNMISVARAFLKNSKIVVLEPVQKYRLSAATKLVLGALDNLKRDRITFTNEHSLHHLTKTDVIIYFEDGLLVETGSHKDLMLRHGKYYQYVKNRIEKKQEQEDGMHDDQGLGVVNKLCLRGFEILKDSLIDTPTHRKYESIAERKKTQSIFPAPDSIDKANLEQESPSNAEEPKPASEHNSTVSITEPFPPLPTSRDSSDQSNGAERAQDLTLSKSRSNIWKPDVPDFVPTSHKVTRSDHRAESSTSLRSQLQHSRNSFTQPSATTKVRRDKESWTQRREREKHEKEIRRRGDAEKKADLKMLKKAQKDNAKSAAKHTMKRRSHLATRESSSSVQPAPGDPPLTGMDGSHDNKAKSAFEKKKRTRTRNARHKAGTVNYDGGSDNKNRVDFQKPAPIAMSESGSVAEISPAGVDLHQAPMYRTPVYRRRAQSKSDPVGFAEKDNVDDQFFTTEATRFLKMARGVQRRLSTPQDDDAHTESSGLLPQVQQRKYRRHGKQALTLGSGIAEIGSIARIDIQGSTAAKDLDHGSTKDDAGTHEGHIRDDA